LQETGRAIFFKSIIER